MPFWPQADERLKKVLKEFGMDNIKLTGMEFFGYHGALAEENKLGQRFLVDLELYLDLHQAGAGDDLSASINYAQAYEVVKTVVEGPAFKTIEAVAEAAAQKLKSSYPLLQGLKITVHKPGAPIAGIFHDVSVTLER